VVLEVRIGWAAADAQTVVAAGRTSDERKLVNNFIIEVDVRDGQVLP
jgi:ketosteroid isomerase-like protein